MEEFLEALRERAGFFLLQRGTFRPFRVLLQEGKVVDTVSESETLTDDIIYDILLNTVNLDLGDPDINASAIILHGESDGYQVVVIEIFRNLREKYQAVFPYFITDGHILFGEDLNKKYQTDAVID
ncbi:hypothetical protein [Chryseobacterium lathyri]|uniref:hypothetical protein n=1 Tax=Chryseobacterium lathyri TaxID=395933 RepID=UPI0027865FE1|nr:hypothetical protein [Chryseobacterium lathyri]MDQ0065117.1 hypothetical protein [Chryseobacterium lathyri]